MRCRPSNEKVKVIKFFIMYKQNRTHELLLLKKNENLLTTVNKRRQLMTFYGLKMWHSVTKPLLPHMERKNIFSKSGFRLKYIFPFKKNKKKTFLDVKLCSYSKDCLSVPCRGLSQRQSVCKNKNVSFSGSEICC